MGNLGMELDYKKLSDNSIDIAEIMLDSSKEEIFEDMLQQEFNIYIDREHVAELLSRCHSVVAEEITNFAKEKLG